MAARKPLKIDLLVGIVEEGTPRPAERRRTALRERIAQQAAAIFKEHGGEKGGGHEKTTAEEISDRSDISVRTFFRYYQSKTDAIYVDVPSAIDDHLTLTSIWLKRVRPAEASLAASVILLTNSLSAPSAAARLIRAMSSKTFVARRSTLREEWRQSLANMVTPYMDKDEDRELMSLTLAINTLNVREIAMEYWYWKDGKISVVDCFNKALAISHKTNLIEMPRSLII